MLHFVWASLRVSLSLSWILLWVPSDLSCGLAVRLPLGSLSTLFGIPLNSVWNFRWLPSGLRMDFVWIPSGLLWTTSGPRLASFRSPVGLARASVCCILSGVLSEWGSFYIGCPLGSLGICQCIFFVVASGVGVPLGPLPGVPLGILCGFRLDTV